MARYNDRDYYTSVNGRITILLRRVPNFRPLPEEILSEIESMSLKDREDVASAADALIGLLQVQITELKVMKERAENRPLLHLL